MINEDLVPLKYITGSYRYEKRYPTAEDLLWDIVSIEKKSVTVDYIDWIEDEIRDQLLGKLVESKNIKVNNGKITVLKTKWDG